MDTENPSIEEGECSSSDESISGYNPIERPADVIPRKPVQVEDDLYDSDDNRPPGLKDSGSESDSDDDKPAIKKRNTVGPWGRRDAIVPEQGGNDTFKAMAAAFQADRKAKARKNNIWGSIIQEQSLSATLSGVGVNKSLKDLNSDRGAETYDFTILQEEKAKEREKRRAELKNGKLDAEMKSYWEEEDGQTMEPGEQQNNETEEGMAAEGEGGGAEKEDERRGTKRSAKDRLGHKRLKLDRYNGERLQPPGEPKQLIDIAEEDYLEKDDKDFAHLLAERLGEEKPELIEGLVTKFGKQVAHRLYKLTQKKEKDGGMEINNGARRRTSGGVYLFLFKADSSLDPTEIKKFLMDSRKQEDRKFLEAKKRKNRKNFDKEMADFLSLRREMTTKKEEEMEQGANEDGKEEEELIDLKINPFSNIIQNLGKQGGGGGELKKSEHPAVDRIQRFEEPDAPPNSVERTLTEYDDDFLDTNQDTENIELM